MVRWGSKTYGNGAFVYRDKAHDRGGVGEGDSRRALPPASGPHSAGIAAPLATRASRDMGRHHTAGASTGTRIRRDPLRHMPGDSHAPPVRTVAHHQTGSSRNVFGAQSCPAEPGCQPVAGARRGAKICIAMQRSPEHGYADSGGLRRADLIVRAAGPQSLPFHAQAHQVGQRGRNPCQGQHVPQRHLQPPRQTGIGDQGDLVQLLTSDHMT